MSGAPARRPIATDQKVGGSNPSERAQVRGYIDLAEGPVNVAVQQRKQRSTAADVRRWPYGALGETREGPSGLGIQRWTRLISVAQSRLRMPVSAAATAVIRTQPAPASAQDK